MPAAGRGARTGGSEAPAKRRQPADSGLREDSPKRHHAATDTKPTPGATASSRSLRDRVRIDLHARFLLASQFLPAEPSLEEELAVRSTLQTADTIVTLCRVLNQPYAVVLTALVYLQMYKNSSARWRAVTYEGLPTTPATINRSFGSSSQQPSDSAAREVERHEQFLIAASCVLLAWKYREDDVRVSKASGKIFEFTSVLYKVYVAQSENCLAAPSVSGWMLQDEGKEITKLKTQLIEHETHLLHALDYHVGPVPLPHRVGHSQARRDLVQLIQSYVRKFLIAIANDLSDLQELASKLDDLVGLLVLECYKTRVCIDYTPGEVLVTCIFKAVCLLTVTNEYPRVFAPSPPQSDYFAHVDDLESRLCDFMSALDQPDISVDRVAQCLCEIRYNESVSAEKRPASAAEAVSK
ncbi:uncharacterized protein BcabD6B2_24880 [Babesia caballi]|uniref:Cyclin N-terminal domain-containing protein n=1 Tax=Babesia caballi TaxID=5871 RepID=A0AAV4LSU2_BABCB|nr:hypothetical protein, conserved [Babesia caballi]